MIWPELRLAFRLRLQTTISAASGLVVVMILVGALFPAVGHTIGQLHIPDSVASLLGGADFGTITGWFRSEIGSIYGPLVVGALAVMAAVGSTAGEEETRIMALELAYPIRRRALVVAKAGAAAGIVVVAAAAIWVGMVAGVAVGGGGISIGHVTALAVHVGFFGFATGGVALGVAAGTGRRMLGTGVAAAVGIAGWLVNSIAPLVAGLSWLRYLSTFYYYAGHDPLTRGVSVVGLVVLAAVALAGTAAAIVAFERRDLRA